MKVTLLNLPIRERTQSNIGLFGLTRSEAAALAAASYWVSPEHNNEFGAEAKRLLAVQSEAFSRGQGKLGKESK